MANRDKLICGRLSKYSKEAAEDILCNLKKNYDEDEIIKSPKKKYPASLWTCPACNVATTMKNKPNHERTDKHKKLLKEFQDVYRIEKVLKMRNLRGVEQALIKWSGYSEKHNTWIPAAHLYMDSSCTFRKIELKEYNYI